MNRVCPRKLGFNLFWVFGRRLCSDVIHRNRDAGPGAAFGIAYCYRRFPVCCAVLLRLLLLLLLLKLSFTFLRLPSSAFLRGGSRGGDARFVAF